MLGGVLRLLPEKPPVEVVPIGEAYGRVAARDIRSKRDVPDVSSSHMDGFAVDSRDTRNASEASPAVLKVVSEAVLGAARSTKIKPGQACRVSTGSYLPQGADAVIPIEDAPIFGRQIRVTAPFAQGSFVYETGGDLRKGDVVVAAGKTFRAQDLGLALSLGETKVEVFRRPVVALLATGNELTDAEGKQKGKVKNSHTLIFMRLVEETGCVPLNLGIAPDERGKILAKVRRGLREADLLLTMGGTSLGKRDLVGEAISSLKPRTMFHGIRMDRGRVAGAAVVGHKPVVMMPGPIQGAMNAFVLSGLPIIRRLSGRGIGDVTIKVVLKSGWEARRRFPHFVKVLYLNVSDSPDGPVAEPVVGETESMTVLTRSNAFAVISEGTTSLGAGDKLDAILLPGFSFA